MQRLIYLKVDYRSGSDGRTASFKQFRSDLKKLPYIKIIKELDPKPHVLIEFPDDKMDQMYIDLPKIDVVDIIDATLPQT